LAELPGVPLENQTFDTATILPGAYLTSNIRFNVNETGHAVDVSGSANNIIVVMTTKATAGSYSQSVMAGDNAVWNFTTATLIKNYG